MLVLAFLLSISACSSRQPIWKSTLLGNDIRWCQGPMQRVYYRIDECVPYYRMAAIRQAMAFWHTNLGRDLFVESRTGQLTFTCATSPDRGRLAHTDVFTTHNGCAVGAVVMSIASLDSGENMFWSEVYKHEIGHVLGLMDNETSIVMHGDFLEWPIDGRGLTEGEKAAVREHYPLP